jgi:hypothetical protein
MPSPSRTARDKPVGNLLRTATLNMGFLPRLRRRGTGKDHWYPSQQNRKAALQWDLTKSIPLKDLIPMLSRVQRAFFEKLDVELDKVENFYLEREKDMRTRCARTVFMKSLAR